MSWFLSAISTEVILWIVHITVLLGLILYIGGQFTLYKLITTPVAILIIALGVFYEGYFFSSKDFLKQIDEFKEKVKLAEENSKKANIALEIKVVEKVKYIEKVKNENLKVIETVVTKYDNMCTLSNAAIVLHNSASQNVVSPSSGDAVEGASDIKASELLTTVTENYGTYYKVREQLLGWQEWYKEQKKIYESVK